MPSQFNARMPTITIQQIEAMVQTLGATQTQIVILAIDRMYREERKQMNVPTVSMLDRITPEQADAIADGKIAVSPSDRLYTLDEHQRAAYSSAKATGYITEALAQEWEASVVYRIWCRSIGRPFVAMRTRATRAQV